MAHIMENEIEDGNLVHAVGLGVCAFQEMGPLKGHSGLC